ncbi:MAG: YdeI/OmpD-associated family protein [Vicinamibacteria bacterium]
MKPRAFATPADFRAWLQKHHATGTELLMRLYKTHARAKGIGYREALDEALCFGWIDGVRRALDEDSFVQRFSPRRKKSVWSAVNIKRATELQGEGRLTEPGLAAFRARQEGPAPYSFESRALTLAPAFLEALRKNRKAWAHYESLAPGYRRTAVFWVMTAKREETRARRFETLLEACAHGRKIGLLEPATGTRAGKRGPRRPPS